MADEQTKEAADDRPKVLKNMSAWVGGATALVVAIGGLVTAFSGLLGNHSLTPPDRNDATLSVPKHETSYTTGDGGTLALVDGMWVWTDKDENVYRYKEVSNDGVTTVAVMKAGGSDVKDVWLRWPNAGGQALQSFDDQTTWERPIEVTVAGADAS